MLEFSLLLFAAMSAGMKPDYDARIPIEVRADSAVLGEKPIEAELSLKPGLDPQSIHVVEYADPALTVVKDSAVPWQFDPAAEGRGTLTFLMRSGIAAGQTRRFAVHFSRQAAARSQAAGRQPVRVEDVAEHQGQPSLKITIDNATFIYHKEGAAFASLYDRDGNDWISYRPGGGSAGEFRGIPNLGEFGHPGYRGNHGSRTVVKANGPLRVTVFSESKHGSIVWDFFPAYARLTVLTAVKPFWFLYEGTPGGKLDVPEDFWVTAGGTRRSVAESWNGDLAGREWVYFADGQMPRALFLANHQDDGANDQFWQMESNMTVWGFGREYRCCTRYLTEAPARFTVGLLDTKDYARASAAISDAIAEPKVLVGDVEIP